MKQSPQFLYGSLVHLLAGFVLAAPLSCGDDDSLNPSGGAGASAARGGSSGEAGSTENGGVGGAESETGGTADSGAGKGGGRGGAEAGGNASVPEGLAGLGGVTGDAGEGGTAGAGGDGTAGAGGESSNSICGNGIVEGSETCDDGNAVTESCGYGTSCEVCTASCVTETLPGGFCGDGIVNGPEECDGDSGCSNECTSTRSERCEACIQANEDEDYVAFNALCNEDPLCVAVKECLVDDRSSCNGKSCFDYIQAECYCGTDADLTECVEAEASFVPSGRCRDVILAGAGPGATYLDGILRFHDPDYSTGKAVLIIDHAREVCATECGFSPFELNRPDPCP